MDLTRWRPEPIRLPSPTIERSRDRERDRLSGPGPMSACVGCCHEGIVGSAAIVMLAEVCGVLRDPCGRVE